MGESAPRLEARKVENLQIVDGKFTWDGDERQEEFYVKNTFLVIESAKGTERHIVCLLIEDLGNPTNPWKLALLSADKHALPDQIASQHPPLTRLPPYLASGEGRRVDTIVSTNSGTGTALTFWQTILQPLLRLVCEELGEPSPDLTTEEHVLKTQSAESVSEFAKSLGTADDKAPSGKPELRTIILLSGDGGVVDLLNPASGISTSTEQELLPTIALLPLGTGNALFHSTHKSAYSYDGLLGLSPLGWGLRTLLTGEGRALPAFEASFPSGSNIIAPGTDPDAPPDRPVSSLKGAIVASYGFHASIVYESDTPAYRVHGAKRFGMVAQQLLIESHPYEARVELLRPGSTIPELVPRDSHAYVLTTLVSNLEQAFTISPGNRPLDGQLHTVHFAPLGGERTMEAMKAAYDGGKHVDLKWDDGQRVEYDKVDEIRIQVLDEDARWRKVCIDGTIVGIPKGGTVTVRNVPRSPFRILVSREGLLGE